MAIGGEIKRWREARGISQLKLAYLAKISQSHMCRIEKNEHSDIRLNTLRRIAAALEVAPLQLAPDLAGRHAPPPVAMPPRVRLRGGPDGRAAAEQINLILQGIREASEQKEQGILSDRELDLIKARLLRSVDGI